VLGKDRIIKLDKEQVAVSQLDTAITLLFNGGDIVPVHTLAAAAANILNDLLHAIGETSWRDKILNYYPEYKKVMKSFLSQAQNYFKHADRDSNEDIEFEEANAESIIFLATFEYSELLRLKNITGNKLTIPMYSFQFWYFAKTTKQFTNSPDELLRGLSNRAQSLFPNINDIPRNEQIAVGLKFLNSEIDRMK
jgi:hypothetical protein